MSTEFVGNAVVPDPFPKQGVYFSTLAKTHKGPRSKALLLSGRGTQARYLLSWAAFLSLGDLASLDSRLVLSIDPCNLLCIWMFCLVGLSFTFPSYYPEHKEPAAQEIIGEFQFSEYIAPAK
jgi:hypothetical protein